MQIQWFKKFDLALFSKQKQASALAQQGYYAVGLMLTKVISLFLLPYLAKQLGLVEFARLETLLAIINGATIVVGLGMVNLLYRKVGQSALHEKKQITAAIAGNAVSVALLVLAFCLISTPIILPLLNSLVSLSIIEFWFCSALICIEGILGVSLAWLRMQDKAKLFFQMMVTRGVLYALFVSLGLAIGLGLTWVLFASLFAALYQVIHLIIIQYRDTRISFSWHSLYQTFLYGWPFVISGLAMYATQGMEVVILAQNVSPESLASYVIAVKLFLIAALLNQPFLLWWYPKRMGLIAEKNGLSRAGAGATLGVLLAMISSTLIWLWSPWVIGLLFADGVAPALSYLPWLLIAGVLKQWGALFNLGCFSSENSRTQMYIEVSTGVFCLIGFPIAIELAQVHGALAVFVMSQAIRLLAYWLISQHYLSVVYPVHELVKGIVLCVSLIFLASLFSRAYVYQLDFTSFSACIGITLLMIAALAYKLQQVGRKIHATDL
ncbi:lipopolysaccharide biosynthesis protein [Marinomonas transparens]|uniref:Oligosaccharide flippase family protein n=1 Tax=Marinomonas transparens TaxID=2795388 RepID=A0A934JW15_9GAMM|nr:oligosaccharide flippase family protein [Marinomonas transparens]MBJ7538249.1 oligosaccharide flippase family protein [Marinomonas transparens]